MSVFRDAMRMPLKKKKILARKNMTNRAAVIGRAQKKSLISLNKLLKNHASIENKPFSIYKKKLITAFNAIEKSDNINIPRTFFHQIILL